MTNCFFLQMKGNFKPPLFSIPYHCTHVTILAHQAVEERMQRVVVSLLAQQNLRAQRAQLIVRSGKKEFELVLLFFCICFKTSANKQKKNKLGHWRLKMLHVTSQFQLKKKTKNKTNKKTPKKTQTNNERRTKYEPDC